VRRWEEDEHVAQKFSATVLVGKLHSAVYQVTQCAWGGLLWTHLRLIQSRASRCIRYCRKFTQNKGSPNLDNKEESCFEDYPKIPGIIPSFAKDDVMTIVDKQIHGGVGPGSWTCICYGNATEVQSSPSWVDDLANDSLSIAAYLAFTNGLLLVGGISSQGCVSSIVEKLLTLLGKGNDEDHWIPSKRGMW